MYEYTPEMATLRFPYLFFIQVSVKAFFALSLRLSALVSAKLSSPDSCAAAILLA
ncbi:hypothetical protein TLA_TLA_01336 [Tessaracoccus lapidicaptus]|nr:hypothetical protein TLA_TLA_01336 [Tessaracoccus lapidicaptus]